MVLPAIDTLYEDRHFVEMVKGRMEDKAGYAMLVAFAGDRDFERTLTLARQIDKLYPGTRFHRYSKELAKELPGRMDDFKKFKLPTADEGRVEEEVDPRRADRFSVRTAALVELLSDGAARRVLFRRGAICRAMRNGGQRFLGFAPGEDRSHQPTDRTRWAEKLEQGQAPA